MSNLTRKMMLYLGCANISWFDFILNWYHEKTSIYSLSKQSNALLFSFVNHPSIPQTSHKWLLYVQKVSMLIRLILIPFHVIYLSHSIFECSTSLFGSSHLKWYEIMIILWNSSQILHIVIALFVFLVVAINFSLWSSPLLLSTLFFVDFLIDIEQKIFKIIDPLDSSWNYLSNEYLCIEIRF